MKSGVPPLTEGEPLPFLVHGPYRPLGLRSVEGIRLPTYGHPAALPCHHLENRTLDASAVVGGRTSTLRAHGAIIRVVVGTCPSQASFFLHQSEELCSGSEAAREKKKQWGVKIGMKVV